MIRGRKGNWGARYDLSSRKPLTRLKESDYAQRPSPRMSVSTSTESTREE